MKAIYYFSFFTLSVLCSFPVFCQTQVAPDTNCIAAIVDEQVLENDFSGTVLVAHQGHPIFFRSYGSVGLPGEEALTNEYRYSIASITKLFTAVRILQMADSGRIDLHASLLTYLPQWEGQINKKISTHQLLLHRSGLPSETKELFAKPYSSEQFIAESLKTKTKAKRGEFNYNNIDYMLLGQLIEKISGRSWEQEMQTHILDKANMKKTGFLSFGDYPDTFAYSYSYNGGENASRDILFYIENFMPAAGMYATAMDLLLFDQALYTQELLSDNARSLLYGTFPKEDSYTGYSVWNYRYPYVKENPLIMERRGGILGSNSVILRFLEMEYTVIILSNNDRFDPDSFGDPSNMREAIIGCLFTN